MNDFPHNPSDPTAGTDDLDARIRSLIGDARMAAPPAPQLDLDDSVVPLRRRETTRRAGRGWLMAGLAAVGTAAAVAAAVVVMNDDTSERLQPAPPATEPDTATTVPDSAPDSTSGPTTTSPADPSITWVAYTAGPDGVIGVDARGRTVTVVDEPMAAVAAGPEGALYVQRQSAPAGSVQPRPYDPEDTAILRFDPATSALVDAKVPHVDGTWLRLHDVGTLAGAEVILYEEMQTPNPGLDAGRLLLLDVGTGDTTVVDDDFGGWEKWSNLFQVADNGLVVGEKVDLTETYPTIYRVLDSAPEITPGSLGLQASYSECSTECARHLTVDPTGTAFAYLWRNAVIWTDLVPQRTTAVDVGPDLPAQVMVTSDAVGVVSTSGDTPSGDSSTSVRILTLDDREIEVPGASVSLYSEVPAPAATDDPDTTGVDGRLVADQRMATEDDLRRLPEDINGTGMVMACSAPTTKRPEYTTDSPIFSGVPSSVHLAAWIAEVNAYFSLTGTVDEVPAAGWTTIVLGPDSWFVLPDADGNWRAIVRTIPWNDSWRVSDAWFCTTDDVPTTETTGPTPVFAPLEDGMPAVTEALGETLTYGSAQEAVDALVAALTRPDGCDVAPTATALELTTGPEEAGYSLLWRYGCDDSSGGAQIEVTVTQDRGGMWTIAAASMATLCLRGVDDTGLCI